MTGETIIQKMRDKGFEIFIEPLVKAPPGAKLSKEQLDFLAKNRDIIILALCRQKLESYPGLPPKQEAPELPGKSRKSKEQIEPLF